MTRTPTANSAVADSRYVLRLDDSSSDWLVLALDLKCAWYGQLVKLNEVDVVKRIKSNVGALLPFVRKLWLAADGNGKPLKVQRAVKPGDEPRLQAGTDGLYNLEGRTPLARGILRAQREILAEQAQLPPEQLKVECVGGEGAGEVKASFAVDVELSEGAMLMTLENAKGGGPLMVYDPDEPSEAIETLLSLANDWEKQIVPAPPLQKRGADLFPCYCMQRFNSTTRAVGEHRYRSGIVWI